MTPPVLVHPRYEPREILGRGGQGLVVRVVDREAPERPLCAKLWRSNVFEEQALVGEFALLARVRINGMVRAHDLSRDATTGAPFLVEDFVEGEEAGDFCSAVSGDDSARSARVTNVLRDVASTLASLHDAGFVHGDIKPAHVRMTRRLSDASVQHAPPARGGDPARPVLLDLGAAVGRARSAEAPRAVSPAFASPEVLAGETPSPRSDLHGLGVLAWWLATGRSPGPAGAGSEVPLRSRAAVRAPLRRLAPWIHPALADLVEQLLSTHPRDRPADAREVLAALGAFARGAGTPPAPPPAPIGRHREISDLLGPSGSAVRYLIGPSGVGKSHLAREVVTRSLLEGSAARLVSFPSEKRDLVARLVVFLRGSEEACPFVRGDAPLLVVLDDLHLAPAEITGALDAYRCRLLSRAETPTVRILATAREAPEGADSIEVGPLDDAEFASLCRAVGIEDDGEIRQRAREAGNVPGWLMASAGRVPLTRTTALDRIRGLGADATSVLAAIALAGGTLSEAICLRLAGRPSQDEAHAVVGELLASSLVTRRGAGSEARYELTAPALTRDLGAALATYDRVDRLASVLLEHEDVPVAALLATAGADPPPASRAELYARASARARLEGLRTEEIEALLALAADPARRTTDLCCRLERLTRDAGTAQLHPQVLDWLDEVAARDPTALSLALRRRAESRARAGDAEGAQRLAEEARAAAAALCDPVGEALALATMGAVALYRASFGEADRALTEARARLAGAEGVDAEEVARLEHNAGVVALYRGRVDVAIDAFERSLQRKRRLGERLGMRACLLNLGLALAKAGRLDDADRALEEASSLARSLGQLGGRGWVLAARADVAVRRRDVVKAERWIAEAATMRGSLPAAVLADLCVLRAQVALLEGDGARASRTIAELEPEIRAADALVDARAATIEAEAQLCTLPARPRQAARLAVRAVRRARAAALGEAEAAALRVLEAARIHAARARGGAAAAARYSPSMPPSIRADAAGAPASTHVLADQDAWRWLAEVAGGLDAARAAAALVRVIATTCGAERAFVARVDPAGRVVDAWGSDLDGLPLAEARGRVPEELARTVLGRSGPVYQRDVETAGGRGSRVAIAAPEHGMAGDRAVLVLEHRFAPAHFDRLDAGVAERWVTLAALSLRLLDGADLGKAEELGPLGGETSPRLDRSTASAATEARAARRSGRGAAAQPSAGAGHTTAVPLVEGRNFPGIVGQSTALRKALARLEAALDGELPVLVTGETGVGKELFARALHDLGPRRAHAFVAINCGAIPDALFEAELFGHARGSFTGAERARPGLIARAEGGTLLLDEVGELPLLRQATLLRALESKRYRPVGSDEERPFDVRIVAATNRDLADAARERTFRSDLLYRLNAIEIHVPPLRQRRGDVPLLVQSFLERAELDLALSDEAMAALDAYAWPGNVRELEHHVQRLGALKIDRIEVDHLPRTLRSAVPPAVRGNSGRSELRPRLGLVPRDAADDPRAEITAALDATGGNISRAAERLGLTRHGFKKRMTRLGMRPARTGEEDA